MLKTYIIAIAGLAVCVLPALQGFMVEIYVSVVSALQRHYHTDCVFLLYFGTEQHEGYGSLSIPLQEASLLVNLQALASSGSVPTATLDMQTIEGARKKDHCSRNRPFYVLVTVNNVTSQVLNQVFQKSSSSEPRWLMFIDNASLEDTFRDVYIPFDCEFLVARPAEGQRVQLTEVYRVSRTRPLQTYPWGSWSPGSGLQGPPVGLYTRRNDLQGITLKAAFLPSLPSNVKTVTSTGVVFEISRAIYNLLQRKLNFSLVDIQPEDMLVGYQGQNGSWTGLIGNIQRGEADMAGNMLLQTSQRRSAMRITQPIFSIRNFVYIREPQATDWNWAIYLTPFNLELWAAVLLSILLLSAVLLLAQYSTLRYGNEDIDKSFLCSFCDILHYVTGTFCSQGHWTTPHQWSSRLVYWLSYVLSLTLWAAYSANLVAYLTEKPLPSLPITSFQGLVEDVGYQFIVLKQSPDQQYFETTQDPVLKEIFLRKLKPNLNNLPIQALDGFQRVCDSKTTFLCHTGQLDVARKNMSCKVVPLPDAKYFTVTSGLAVSKRAPYADIILQTLQGLWYTGIMKKLLEDDAPTKTYPEEDSIIEISFINVAPIFVIWTVAILVATFIMLLRVIHQNYRIQFPGRSSRITSHHGSSSRIPPEIRDVSSTTYPGRYQP